MKFSLSFGFQACNHVITGYSQSISTQSNQFSSINFLADFANLILEASVEAIKEKSFDQVQPQTEIKNFK